MAPLSPDTVMRPVTNEILLAAGFYCVVSAAQVLFSGITLYIMMPVEGTIQNPLQNKGWSTKLIPAIYTLISLTWSISSFFDPRDPPIAFGLICGILFSFQLPSYFWCVGTGDAICGFMLCLINMALFLIHVTPDSVDIPPFFYPLVGIAGVPAYYLFAAIETVGEERSRRFLALCQLLKLPVKLLGVFFRAIGVRGRNDCPYHAVALFQNIANSIGERNDLSELCFSVPRCCSSADLRCCIKQTLCSIDCLITGYVARLEIASTGSAPPPYPNLDDQIEGHKDSMLEEILWIQYNQGSRRL